MAPILTLRGSIPVRVGKQRKDDRRITFQTPSGGILPRCMCNEPCSCRHSCFRPPEPVAQKKARTNYTSTLEYAERNASKPKRASAPEEFNEGSWKETLRRHAMAMTLRAQVDDFGDAEDSAMQCAWHGAKAKMERFPTHIARCRCDGHVEMVSPQRLDPELDFPACMGTPEVLSTKNEEWKRLQAKHPDARLVWNTDDMNQFKEHLTTSLRVTADYKTMGQNVGNTMAPAGTRVQYTFIYCCCSKNSRAGDDRYLFHTDENGKRKWNAQVFRATSDEDLASEATMKEIREIIGNPNSGHIFLFGSLPCTWGSRFASKNYRKFPDTFPEKHAETKREYDRLLAAFAELANLTREVGGDVLQEMPHSNKLWCDAGVKKLHRKLGTQKTTFNGCQVGARATTGERIKKAWTIAATFPEVRVAFGNKVCCGNHKHRRIEGKETALSAHYPWEMCDLLHWSCETRAEAKRKEMVCAAAQLRKTKGESESIESESLQVKLSEGAILPARATPMSAGYDVYANVQCIIEPAGCKAVGTGVAIKAPQGTYARIAPRSGLALKKMIGIGAGVVDIDYTGEVQVVVFNHGKEPFIVKKGDKIAQIILEKISYCPCVQVQELASTKRGENGFGSSDSTVEPSNLGYEGCTAKDCCVKERREGPPPLPGVDISEVRVSEPSDEEFEMCMAMLDKGDIEAALKVVDRWIIDTGCGKDIVCQRYAALYQNIWRKTAVHTFGTGNGVATADHEMTLKIPEFDDEIFKPLIMEDSPSVISVGLRTRLHGYGFVWLPGRAPCIILPSGRIVPLQVSQDVPVLDARVAAEASRDQTYLASLCGVERRRGKFVLRFFDGPMAAGVEPTGDDADSDDTERGISGKDEQPAEELASEKRNKRADAAEARRNEKKEMRQGTYKKNRKKRGRRTDTEEEQPDEEDESDTTAPDEDDPEIDTADDSELEDEEAVLNTLRAAKDFEHTMTHRPGCACRCDACLEAKTRQKMKFKDTFSRPLTGFGDICTMDHIYAKNWYQSPGIGNKPDAWTMIDLYSSYGVCDPVDSKDTVDTVKALRFARGLDEIKLMYSDSFKSLKKACTELDIMHEFSTPGIHETNARIERFNQDVQLGARALMIRAGLPSVFWVWAAPCYCFLLNTKKRELTRTDAAGDKIKLLSSPWKERFGTDFKGTRFPFGSLVFFMPAPTKYDFKGDKFAPRLKPGIFLGYQMKPGGMWSGEYIVADLSDFAGGDFREDAAAKDWNFIRPHITKTVKMDSYGVRFPLKPKHMRYNNTIEGIEEAQAREEHEGVLRNRMTAEERRANVGYDEIVQAENILRQELEDYDSWPKVDDKDIPNPVVGEDFPGDPELIRKAPKTMEDHETGREDDEVPEEHFMYDSIGREFKADCMGYKIINKKVNRPYAIDPQEWKTWKPEKKKEVADYFANIARKAKERTDEKEEKLKEKLEATNKEKWEARTDDMAEVRRARAKAREVKVWRGEQKQATVLRTYVGDDSAPNWEDVFRRVTMDASTEDVIEDLWPKHDDSDGDVCGVLPGGPRDIITELHYRTGAACAPIGSDVKRTATSSVKFDPTRHEVRRDDGFLYQVIPHEGRGHQRKKLFVPHTTAYMQDADRYTGDRITEGKFETNESFVDTTPWYPDGKAPRGKKGDERKELKCLWTGTTYLRIAEKEEEREHAAIVDEDALIMWTQRFDHASKMVTFGRQLPDWSSVIRRRIKDAETEEVLHDLWCEEEASEEELHGPIPDSPRDIVVEFYTRIGVNADEDRTDYMGAWDMLEQMVKKWDDDIQQRHSKRTEIQDLPFATLPHVKGKKNNVPKKSYFVNNRRRKNPFYLAPPMPVTAGNGEPSAHRVKNPDYDFLLPCGVAEPIPRKKIDEIPKAMEARQAEWDRLVKKEVWKWSTVREWRDVAREGRERGETIHMARIFGIMVLKNAELEEKLQKYKYRVVFQGNNVVDANWQAAMFQDLGSSPASMESGKLLDFIGTLREDHGIQQADAEQAYVQAKLSGPTTWIYVPDEAWPDEWYYWNADGTKGAPKYEKPVVILEKALYGHPDAGTLWEKHCDQRLRQCGFKPIESWPSCYYHARLDLTLSVYVDDFKLAGPAGNLSEGWDLIRKHIHMEDPTDLKLYLGCQHVESKITVDGHTHKVIEYNVEPGLAAACDKYEALVKKMTGEQVKWCEVPTPFLTEDAREGPSCHPAETIPDEGFVTCCPWCRHTFVPRDIKEGKPLNRSDSVSTAPTSQSQPMAMAEDEGEIPEGGDDGATDSASKAAKRKSSGQESSKSKKKKTRGYTELEEVKGELQEIASSVLMKVLYSARLARFDLLRAVNKLACDVTRWSPMHDKRLLRLMKYIKCTLKWRQYAWIGDSRQYIVPHLFADADLAGDPETQRSTTGLHASMMGPHTNFPTAALSKKQGALANSTPEAETVAANTGYLKMLAPQLDFMDAVGEVNYIAIFREDNQAMMRVIETGKNPTMKYLNRVHRMSIANLHERLGNGTSKDKVNMVYTKSEAMAADIYTKVFTDKSKWEHACDLINVTTPQRLPEMIRASNQRFQDAFIDNDNQDLVPQPNKPIPRPQSPKQSAAAVQPSQASSSSSKKRKR